MQLAIKILKNEIKELQKQTQDALKSDVLLLNFIMKYLLQKKGKMIRPYFVFLSALLHGKITPSTYRAANAIELLHNATLIHDDIVDNSNKRRGYFSIPSIWKNKISVLAGDFMLSKGLLVLLESKDFEILTIISEATKKMSEGELLQLQKGKLSLLKEKDYLKITEGKTASLFASACMTGAYSVLQNHKATETMEKLGTAIGMAFQIKDDLLDLSLHNTGKPHGQDLKEKKMTLPIIYSLNKASFWEKREIKSLIKSVKKKNDTISKIKAFISEKGGIEYTTKIMNSYISEAKNILSHYPTSKAKEALEDIIEFIISRKK